MASFNEVGQPLLESIKSKDVQQFYTQVHQFKEKMRDVTVGADYVLWISEPANLTTVHKALAEDLQVPQRLLAIKRLAVSRTQKAVLLIQAIEMAVKKVHGL